MTVRVGEMVAAQCDPSEVSFPVDSAADCWTELDDEWLQASAEPSLSEDDELHSTVVEMLESWTLYERDEWYRLVVLGQGFELPTVEEAWQGVGRVAPRPLGGVSGVSGPVLAGRLAAVDPAVLSPAQLVELMTGAERLARWAQGVQLAAVAAFTGYATVIDPGLDDHPLPGRSRTVETGFATRAEIEEFCSDGIGAALGMSFTAAQQLIEAASLTAELPQVAESLAAGEVDLSRVKIIAAELKIAGRDGEQDWVEEMIATHGPLTPGKLRNALRREVLARHLGAVDAAHEYEKKKRGCWFRPADAGMANLTAYLSAEEARLAYQTINAKAWADHDRQEAESGPCQDRGDDRSMDNLRADAFMDLIQDLFDEVVPAHNAEPEASAPEIAAASSASGSSGSGGSGGSGDDCACRRCRRGRRRGRSKTPARVMTHVYIRGSTLAGIDNQPADLLGYGPISANHARDICADSTLIRILTDPFSADIRAIDTPAYRLPKKLRWAIQARDRTCIFPTCNVPANDVQADHRTPHPLARTINKATATGRTSFINNDSLCQRHHRMKTHGGWTAQTTAGQSIEWIAPTGHTYLRPSALGPPQEFWTDPTNHPQVPADDDTPPF